MMAELLSQVRRQYYLTKASQRTICYTKETPLSSTMHAEPSDTPSDLDRLLYTTLDT